MFSMMYICLCPSTHTHTNIRIYIFLDLEQDMYVVYNSIGGSLYCVPAVIICSFIHPPPTVQQSSDD